jgi:hypothetical protein
MVTSFVQGVERLLCGYPNRFRVAGAPFTRSAQSSPSGLMPS